jgi:uncharacterized protein (TIGR03790 family)
MLAVWTWLGVAQALQPGEVLVVGNRNSPVSRSICEYYVRARGIPTAQLVMLDVVDQEEIDRAVFDKSIAAPIGAVLRSKGWVDRILAIVTTKGVPLKIRGSLGPAAEAASVDSELALLYQDLRGGAHRLAGSVPNPYYRSQSAFQHPRDALYLVARLAGYNFSDVRGMIDRSLQARNRGVVVLDLKSYDLDDGNYWLKQAAQFLSRGRAVLEESGTVVKGARDVIGYASWGSNDPNRKERDVGFQYLPGALVTEFVSTDGRTFEEPPAGWNISSWSNRLGYFAGSPQSLSADFIRQGATGVSGHVYEPYLTFAPRPEVLFPAYLGGRTLAESFYASIPALSWMNVVIGDPLCRLAP